MHNGMLRTMTNSIGGRAASANLSGAVSKVRTSRGPHALEMITGMNRRVPSNLVGHRVPSHDLVARHEREHY